MFYKIKPIIIVMLCSIFTIVAALPLCADTQEAGDIIENETGLYYTVKKGDTLWDLSAKFFDSPWVWPDLWSKNKQVLNPHRIYPGQRLRFYKHEGVYVVEEVKEELSPEPVQVVEVKEEEYAEVEEVPPIGLPSYPYRQIDRVGFIRKETVTSHGTIFKAKEKKTMISTGDVVYVNQQKGVNSPLLPGNLYTIYRTLDKSVRDVTSNKIIGIQYDLKGVLEITEVIKKEPCVAAARIVRCFRDIRLDDLLIPYNPRSPEIIMTESTEGIAGEFIASEDHQKLFAMDTIAFINRGDNDGIKPGQSYSIFYIEDLDIVSKKVDYGELFVLHTETNNSTVLITKAKKAVKPGTKFHTPVQ